MGAQVVDYRVSTLVVLCKDCGHDVGLYPARHKCQPVERPAMPALPAQYSKEKKLNIPGSLELSARTISSGSSSSMASSPSPSFSSAETPTSKWSSRLQNNNKAEDDNEESVYFSNFAANLPETNEASGKKLWGKVRQNEKWKQLSEKNEKPKQSGKLWGKLIQATQTMADKIPTRDDRGAESDEDDWEGETHVSRILREYYEKKRLRLPDWLFDENVPVSRKPSSSNRRDNGQLSPAHPQQPDGPMRTPSRRRLWEQNPQDAKNMSSRERERQELRQAQPPMPPPSSGSENRSRYSNRDQYYNEDRDNSSSSGGRYSNNRDTYEDDRYNSNRHYEDDYERRSQPTREDDRYYDDRYKSNHSNRRDDYGQGRDRYDTTPPPPPQTRGSRDQPRYYDDDHRYQQQPSSQRPLSPLQKQRSNSTSRARYYEEDRGGYYDTPPAKSERSTRGYGDRSNRYDQGPPPAAAAPDYDDYYDTRRAPSQSKDRAARYHDHGPPEMSRREPSIRSGGRRYGNDPSYF
ncbi:unnamed protein product [Mucor circinelloides]|uniref:Mso1 N-terminal domain-containing protein n=1 Tax=Mucor circinelloides f. circinelloides (strain 1006PhL) TaxID=1220926 RepID=S2KAP6_MUCC1|nr:hypothetical protein HMPREF1544_00546 [Mucor circinelloides 1006PhL]